MGDEAFKNANVRRDQLAADMSALRQKLDELGREAKRIDEWLRAYSEFAGGGAIAAETEPKSKTNPPKEEIADFAYSLIEARGRPVARSFIAAALVNAGIKLEGKKPDMVLSTMLWRMKSRVVRLKGHGYWMADKDFPEAGYVAGTGDDGDPGIEGDEDGENRHEYKRPQLRAIDIEAAPS